MMITLINCDVKLKAIGIDMNEIGSSDLFTEKLIVKAPNYSSWSYINPEDKLEIDTNTDEYIDLTDFGEVVINEYFSG